MESTAVSVIIPAHNEAETIGDLVRSIQALYPEYEIIVVNDGSGDNTGKVAGDAGAIVYSHPYNIGNGAAIKSGIRIASGDTMVFMDGDGQHEPKDIGKLLEHLPAFDMVVGARPKGRQSSWRRGLGNRLLNWLATYVSKFKIMDLTSGFRAIKAPIARKFLYLLPNTYSYPTTITLGVLRSGRSLKYIPVDVQVRKGGKSNIKLFRDGVRFFMIITKICALYSPLRIFLPLSFFMFLMGFGYYLYTYISWGRFTNMSALLFTTSVLVFLMGLISEQITQMRFERSEGDRFI
ncbi:glycosyltransferase family 2 protein [Thermodesulfobacteriota bacterium]